jgi:hypothetical protein
MPRGGYRESNPGGRPPLPEGEKAKAVTFRLPPPTVELIKAKADAHGVSQAKLITLAVDAFAPKALPGDELQ